MSGGSVGLFEGKKIGRAKNLEKLEREHAISEDELRRAEKELQKLTDQYVTEVDQVLAAKERELSEI